jgi:thymidylate synthase
MQDAPEISIRGMVVKESLNFSFSVNSLYPLTSFRSRGLNLDYAKKEVLWYIRGDRFDLSICEVAGAWNDIIQDDGGINSNYGQTIFTGPCHYDWVVEELTRDKYSRRAVMVLGEPDKLKSSNTDHRCTMYIVYHIRNNELIQTVHMRSNDAIYGVTNDIFFFGLLHQFVWSDLVNVYPELTIGKYNHIVNSMHVYQHHFYMVDNILDKEDWYVLPMPTVTPGGEDLRTLRSGKNSNSEFCTWIRG